MKKVTMSDIAKEKTKLYISQMQKLGFSAEEIKAKLAKTFKTESS